MKHVLQLVLAWGFICLVANAEPGVSEAKSVELKTPDGVVLVPTEEIKTWDLQTVKGLSPEALEAIKGIPLDDPEAKKYVAEKLNPKPESIAADGPKESNPSSEPAKEQEQQIVSTTGGPTNIGGFPGIGGTGPNSQASGEPIERHGAIITPVRELSSTNETSSRQRYTPTEKQLEDVSKAMAILSEQPMTSAEKKNLNSVLEKFYQGVVDAKTVSDEMGKIVARLEVSQPLQVSTPGPGGAPQKPDLTLNFDSSQPAANPFGVVGGAQTKVEVNQSNENEAKALVEKGLDSKKDGAIAAADNDYGWLRELLTPSLFVDNVKQAVGALFGSEFDPKVSKSLAALDRNSKVAKIKSEKFSKSSDRGVATDSSRKSPPLIKHVTLASFLFLPFGLGIIAFFVWRKRKHSKEKVIAATEFKVGKNSSKTIFTEKDGTRVKKDGFVGFHPKPQPMTPPPMTTKKKANWISMVLLGATILVCCLVAQKALASPPPDRHIEAELKLGEMYLSKAQCELAKTHLESAAISGSNHARFLMGIFHSQSKCSQNSARAFAWFHLAAQNGHSASSAMVGLWYLYGREVAQSDKKAREYFESAYEQNAVDHALTKLGDQDVASEWGSMLILGIGGEKRPEQGMKLLGYAASQGSRSAQVFLAHLGRRYSKIEMNERHAFWGGVFLGAFALLLAAYAITRRNEETEGASSAEFRGVISNLPPKIQATVLHDLPQEFNESLVECLPQEFVARLAKRNDREWAPLLFDHIPSDLQARMLASIPEEKFSKILKKLKGEAREVVNAVRKAARLRSELRIISQPTSTVVKPGL